MHSSLDQYLGCFHFLAYVNIISMNIVVHVIFRIVDFTGYMPSSDFARSYGRLIPSCFVFFFFFLRKLPSVLHNSYIILHSCQQYKGVPFSTHLLQYLLFVDFFF